LVLLVGRRLGGGLGLGLGRRRRLGVCLGLGGRRSRFLGRGRLLGFFLFDFFEIVDHLLLVGGGRLLAALDGRRLRIFHDEAVFALGAVDFLADEAWVLDKHARLARGTGRFEATGRRHDVSSP